MNTELSANPFAVPTPENLTADEVFELFVPYPEFENLQVGGHQFLHGHRGSGKSMMFRMMSPDSQMKWLGCDFSNLPYFGVYLSIKTTELNNPEYLRLESEIAGSILSEHVLATKFLSVFFSAVNKYCLENISNNKLDAKLQELINITLFNKLKYAGWDEIKNPLITSNLQTSKQIIEYVINIIDQIHASSVQYIKRRSFSTEIQAYQGVLLGFQDVLLPVIKEISHAGILPKNARVFFLLDDADNLNKQQTQILNTWVSYRTTDTISLKISTQLNYKTYKTTSGIRIEAPHDFSSINFTAVQTGSVKERYPELVRKIVIKRLEKYGTPNTNPESFFPSDLEQVEAIQLIAKEKVNSWQPGKSGYRPEDDAYRTARPEFIRRLSGSSKQTSTYKYAGFHQLIHVSSGIIRFFLEPAARMFTEQLRKNADGKFLLEISPTIQDQELRKQADQLLLHEFESLENEVDPSIKVNEVVQLRNLINGIGAIFKAHIMDEMASQRRVFAFTISERMPSKELKNVLKLGVVQGYFYEGSIGSKSGLGREMLYVLTRRLAPAFSLDPIGFSGYISLKSSLLEEMCEDPKKWVNRLKVKGTQAIENDPQQSFLDGIENE